MRFLIRLQATHVPEANLLDSVRTLGRSLGADLRNPKRTSYGALELDVFCATLTDFELLMAALQPMVKVEFARNLNAAPPHREEEDLYSEARALFNAERYWECHEVLEGVWRTKQGAEKRLLQGVILVCAAFVHHQKGESDVALRILKRALELLDFPVWYGGFDIPRLRGEVEEVARTRKFSNFKV